MIGVVYVLLNLRVAIDTLLNLILKRA